MHIQHITEASISFFYDWNDQIMCLNTEEDAKLFSII